jgi:hypothetical protein
MVTMETTFVTMEAEASILTTRGGTNQYFSIIGMLGTVPD